mgnify:CR=1 FL=1
MRTHILRLSCDRCGAESDSTVGWIKAEVSIYGGAVRRDLSLSLDLCSWACFIQYGIGKVGPPLARMDQ